MFKSIEYFTGSDPAPGVPIEDIRPHSRRAYALMIRNRHKPLLKEGFLNVVGAIEMLGGLEYHHDNIVRLSDQLAAGVATDETSLYHEAVAYLNRMGQFSYFARSSFVRRALPQAAAHIPTLRKYLIFRMKNAAHRSIDAPRNETEDELLSHARSLSRAWGMIMTLKPGAREFVWHGHVKADSPEAREFRQHLWETRYLTFQLYDGTRDGFINFTVQLEHDAICREAYAVLSEVILWESTA